MFHPEPEIEQEKEEQFYDTYSKALPRPINVGIYAQEGAGTPLSLAYSSMYNRFQPYYGFGYGYGRDGYYNSYGTYYEYDSYYLAGYTMYIPVNTGERKIRTFSTSRDSDGSTETNLNITRTRTTTNSSSNSGYSNSSNVSVTRGTSSSSSSNSSGGRRVTKRK
tara:strand:+ start:594 stop:1085 length:492 start_codon:yes stop_codon:yes gene_type:complete